MMQHLNFSECLEAVVDKIQEFNTTYEDVLAEEFEVYKESNEEVEKELLVLEIESDKALDRHDLKNIEDKFEGFQVKIGSKTSYDSAGEPYSSSVVKLVASL